MKALETGIRHLEGKVAALAGAGTEPGAVLCLIEDGKVRDGDGNSYASVEECEAAHPGAVMICVRFVTPGGEA